MNSLLFWEERIQETQDLNNINDKAEHEKEEANNLLLICLLFWLYFFLLYCTFVQIILPRDIHKDRDCKDDLNLFKSDDPKVN